MKIHFVRSLLIFAFKFDSCNLRTPGSTSEVSFPCPLHTPHSIQLISRFHRILAHLHKGISLCLQYFHEKPQHFSRFYCKFPHFFCTLLCVCVFFLVQGKTTADATTTITTTTTTTTTGITDIRTTTTNTAKSHGSILI